MSPRNSKPQHAPPVMDAYTGMMVVSTACLLIGLILLLAVLQFQYNWELPS